MSLRVTRNGDICGSLRSQSDVELGEQISVRDRVQIKNLCLFTATAEIAKTNLYSCPYAPSVSLVRNIAQPLLVGWMLT